ncbi:unnamed protein product [Heligmosomoides polygyrus]|uniref:MFS domain-containing protein n=1 Tax=Heligmosomoides polygyrus TaxID=6339 RepID=A0A3P7ZMM7_HELPZ|nr:unnamed protein product [Heligmosomoides polygyrus]
MSKIGPSECDDHPKIFVADEKRRVFPSTRFLMAIILSLCFISLSVATSNLAQAMVCMVGQTTLSSHPSEKSADDVPLLPWTSEQQGAIYAAQNIGSLFMLLAGWQADRLNGKWTIAVALTLLILSNSLIPSVATTSPWLVFVFRIITGIGDALLSPSASSMITRWFPPKERPFAVGFVSGGRQIGTLLILPLGGFFCEHSTRFGWPAIFYFSAVVGAVILVAWLSLSADKPSKHFCASVQEVRYIARKIMEERLGKRTDRGNPPWAKLARCLPLYVAVAALVCHEYPLVIMLQLLPKYFSDVLGLSNVVNGVISSLPSVVLFFSKTLSCILASLLTARNCMSEVVLSNLFNFVGSLGLAICVGLTPFLGSSGNTTAAVVVLCLANGFAGMHTPGVQTALVQIAPAYSGIVNGIAFAVAAVFSIMNKMISFYILSSGSSHEWGIVFGISAVVAFLPVVFFTRWGSADIQPWASTSRVVTPKQEDTHSSDSSTPPNGAVVKSLAKCSMFLSHDLST